MLENSLGQPEGTEWHTSAAAELRRVLRERGQWDGLRMSSRRMSLLQIDQTAILLRTLGFSEEILNIYHLHDHVPLILGLVFGETNGS